jgi:hypothetical protein
VEQRLLRRATATVKQCIARSPDGPQLLPRDLGPRRRGRPARARVAVATAARQLVAGGSAFLPPSGGVYLGSGDGRQPLDLTLIRSDDRFRVDFSPGCLVAGHLP